MDIKLRARLSTYSKIESMQSGSNLPDPSIVGQGTLLGVKDGKYKLYQTVDNAAIGGLFGNPEPDPTTVHVNQIDTLFTRQPEVLSITKADVDTLFDNEIQPDVVVSFDAIDSLFKKK